MANPKITITGDSTGAVAAVKRLSTEISGLQSISAKALAFGGVVSVGAAVAALTSITKAAIDQGDALTKLSQSTGIAVEDLSKLQYAADLSGVSAEALKKGLVALSVDMAAAATGAGPAADKYAKFGISVRNADGSVKSSLEILGEWAGQFEAIPDNVGKLSLAIDIFGKKLGADMIPLLNLGQAGLKAMGDEAEALGLVMSADLAKKSEEFNDNLSRLAKLSGAAGIEIAGNLIPALNSLLGAFVQGRGQGLGIIDSLDLATRSGSIEKNIARITEQLTLLKKAKADVAAGKGFIIGLDVDEEIAKQEKLLAYFDKQKNIESQKPAIDAAKRLVIEKQMQDKLAELAQLRGIAEGKVSAEILKTDDKRIAAQIANAQKLRDALSAAWKQSVNDAEAAAKASEAAFDKAADTRQSAEDKARAKERSIVQPVNDGPFRTASGSATDNSVEGDFRKLADSADKNATLAQLATQQGRIENAAKLAKQASKDAERAAALADQIADPQASAAAIREAAQIQASLQEAQGQAEKKKQKDLEDRAKAQNDLVSGLDKQITDLQTKAAAIQVSADISAAQGALATLQGQLDALKDKTVTVTVVKKESGASGDTANGAEGSFARGGYTGPGGKWQPAGIVHAGEFVHRQEVVRQPGALAFLARFNREGMAALRRNGYAAGGLVNNLSNSALFPRAAPAAANAGAGAAAIFNFPGMGSFEATLAPDVMKELKYAFSREALKKGGRR